MRAIKEANLPASRDDMRERLLLDEDKFVDLPGVGGEGRGEQVEIEKSEGMPSQGHVVSNGSARKNEAASDGRGGRTSSEEDPPGAEKQHDEEEGTSDSCQEHDLNRRRRKRVRYRFASLSFILLTLVVLVSFFALGFWRGWDNWIQLSAVTSISDLLDEEFWKKNVTPCCLVFLFLLFSSLAICLSPAEDAELKRSSPFDHASAASVATFWWVFPTLMTARRNRRLTAADLPPLSFHDLPCNLRKSFTDIVDRRPHVLSSPWSLWWTVTFSAQKSVFLHSFFSGWAFLGAMFMDPILLKLLLSSASEQGQEEQDVARALQFRLLVVALLFLSMLLRVTCMEQCYFNSLRVANNARSILIMSVFRSALKSHRSTAEAGRLTNLLATDVDKVGKCEAVVWSLACCTWALLSLPGVIFMTFRLVGRAAFVGIATLVLCNQIASALSKRTQPVVRRLQELRDVRGSLLLGLLRSMRLVKLEGCEASWQERVEAARGEEMKYLAQMRYISASNVLAGSLFSLAVPVSIFSFYSLVQGRLLEATTAFTALAWISQMQWTINTLPGIYNMLATLKPSFQRISDFLSSCQHLDSSPLTLGRSRERPADLLARVKLRNVFHHSQPPAGDDEVVPHEEEAAGSPQTCQLFDIQVRAGEVLLLLGEIGSGKSTLLSLMSGAKPARSMEVEVTRRRAYVSQIPFVLNDTIRANVLFGLDLDEQRYRDAMARSQMAKDIAGMVDGDATLVGRSGVQLSGGQKSRLALARALYADAKIVFLDDVFSAVDAQTGNAIWEEAIEWLVARGVGVVLVTHQLQLLLRPQVSHVAFLSQGLVTSYHAVSELDRSLAGDGNQRKRQEAEDVEGEDRTGMRRIEDLISRYQLKDANQRLRADRQQVDEPDRQVREEGVCVQTCARVITNHLKKLRGKRIDDRVIETLRAVMLDGLKEVEAKRDGLISWEDFTIYLRVFGSCWSLSFLLLSVLLCSLLSVGSNVYLSSWVDSNQRCNQTAAAGESDGADACSRRSQQESLIVYSAFGGCSSLFVTVQSVLLTLCALKASRALHATMLDNVLKAPMKLFDETPVGMIFNRFVQDLANIDNFVPDAVLDLASKTLSVLTQLSLVIIFAPWTLLSLPLILPLYLFIFSAVRIAARDSRRLESIAHSPVYTQFNDALEGLTTISAFGAQARFLRRNEELIQQMSVAKVGNEAVCKWAQALTTQTGSVLYLACGLASIYLHHVRQMSAAEMGLVLLYANTLQRAFMDYMMTFTRLETQFISVERVAEFCRLEEEEEVTSCSHGKRSGRRAGEEIVEPPRPPASHPHGEQGGGARRRGEIVFDNVSLRYEFDKPRVLRGLNLRVRAGTKVALCGRTGCGKSSLFAALCRLYPISSGTISIDGADIATWPLKKLRSSMKVVAQDALLLEGSLLDNLTSFTGSDSPDLRRDIWRVLEHVGLKEKIDRLPGGLDANIRQDDFSEGERQLLSLSRALISTKSNSTETPLILLCDEPTSNVDYANDERVHRVILELPCTVIMICHRLQYIASFDQVVVLEDGSVLEQGSPSELLAEQGSGRLRQLCLHAGLDPDEMRWKGQEDDQR